MAESGYFKTFDGTKLYYAVEGSGPPLVFLYGLACSVLHWRYQIDYFKRHYTTIWLDFRGHHRSEAPENPESLTIETLAHDVECLVDLLKIKTATFLGHSMGVNLVLELYRRAPSRVNAMVLANGAVRSPLESLLKSNIPQLIFPYLYATYQKYPNIANKIWHAQGRSKIASWLIGQLGFNPNFAKASDIEAYVKAVTNMDMLVMLQMLKDYENIDASSWLHRVDVPTLIIAGEHDLVIPRESQELMHQLIPNSEFELIRNGSHCPQIDIPQLVNIIIERFLSRALPKAAKTDGAQPNGESQLSSSSESIGSAKSTVPGTSTGPGSGT